MPRPVLGRLHRDAGHGTHSFAKKTGKQQGTSKTKVPNKQSPKDKQTDITPTCKPVQLLNTSQQSPSVCKNGRNQLHETQRKYQTPGIVENLTLSSSKPPAHTRACSLSKLPAHTST
eukprot:1161347-Pelagomonas_calceolata.AAC.10